MAPSRTSLPAAEIPAPGERRRLTRRLLALALRRRGMCAAAFAAMLLAGLTESAPIPLVRIFFEDVLLEDKAHVARPETGGGRAVTWRDPEGAARGVHVGAGGEFRPLSPEEAAAARPDRSALARAARDASRRLAPDADPTLALLGFLVAAVLATAFAAAVATYANSYVSKALATHVVTDLRVLMMERLLKAPISFFTRRKLGDLQSRFTNDAALTQHTVDIFLSEVLLQPVVILFGVAWAAYVNWRLALAGFLFLPIVVVPVMTLGRKVQKRARRALEAMGESTEAVSQTLSGVRIVKAFAAEDREATRFQAVSEDWRRRSLRTVRARALGRSVMDVTYGVILAVTLGAGGWLVVRDKWDTQPGELLSFFVALGVILNPLKRVVHAFHTWSEALAGAKRLFEIVDGEVEPADAPGARDVGPVRRGVRFDRVSFSYPDTPDLKVLDEVSLDIPAGASVALVGPSGAGKSTLADLLLRFYEPTSGTVTVDGVPLSETSRASLRAQVAVVSQQPFLFNATLFENIRYGRPDATDDEVRAAARAALVEEFLPDLPAGYDTVVGERGASLSGGQMQRITIARALLKNASMMILDEATSNLDARSEALVQQAIFNLVQGRTALIIAHRLSTVERADRIVVLERGRVVESGPHAELLARRGAYFRLQQAQVGAA